MISNLCYASTVTPIPGLTWCQWTDAERLVNVNNTLSANTAYPNRTLTAVEAKRDGQVIIRILETLSADKRGTLLLDCEAFLKESIDPALAVWLEPVGDRNSLRNLRGIEVKA